jgi:hypothetical protein
VPSAATSQRAIAPNQKYRFPYRSYSVGMFVRVKGKGPV